MENVDSVIINKIQKLLALGSNNPNDNEAQAAILKAHEIMAEYGIESIIAEEAQVSYSTEECVHRGDRKFRKNLAIIVATNFKCHTYSYNRQVRFFGRSNHARIAKEVFEYAYAYAYKESNRLCNEYRRKGYNTKDIVNSYAIGFIQGLKEKLDAQSTALMVITPPDVNEEYERVKKELGLRTKKIDLTVTRGNGTAYNRGLSDGRTVMNGRKLEAAS